MELTELRKRIGMNSDTESLLQELAGLQAENKQLRISVGEKVGAAVASERGIMGRSFELGQFAATAVVLLLLGLGGGVYLMDYLNRRRHGGFRV